MLISQNAPKTSPAPQRFSSPTQEAAPKDRIPERSTWALIEDEVIFQAAIGTGVGGAGSMMLGGVGLVGSLLAGEVAGSLTSLGLIAAGGLGLGVSTSLMNRLADRFHPELPEPAPSVFPNSQTAAQDFIRKLDGPSRFEWSQVYKDQSPEGETVGELHARTQRLSLVETHKAKETERSNKVSLGFAVAEGLGAAACFMTGHFGVGTALAVGSGVSLLKSSVMPSRPHKVEAQRAQSFAQALEKAALNS